MNRSFNYMRTIVSIGFVLFIGLFIFKIVLVSNAVNSDKPLYEISVNTFNTPETYFTTEYERDQNSGCIKFKDEFGIRRIVCNNYTITQYGK